MNKAFSAQQNLKIRDKIPVAPASGVPSDRDTLPQGRNPKQRAPERISSLTSDRADLITSI